MTAMTLDFVSDTGICVDRQMRRLALEASAISNVIETFKDTLPSLAERLFQQFTSLNTTDDKKDEVQDIKLKFGKLKVKLPHASYLNYSKTLISVPEGFKGNLLDYVKVLSDMSTEIFQEANKTLGEYNFVLSSFITNKENKISLKDHTDLFVRIQRRREKMTTEIGSFFQSGNNVPKAYLSTAIARFNDLEVLVQSVEKLNQQRKNQNINDISAAVKKSLDLLKIIIDDTENNGIAKVSGNAAMNISSGAYELGKYVEFIAIYRFRVEQVVSTVEKLMTTLDTII